MLKITADIRTDANERVTSREEEAKESFFDRAGAVYSKADAKSMVANV